MQNFEYLPIIKKKFFRTTSHHIYMGTIDTSA